MYAVKNILYLVGSILGIIAFFDSVIKPIMNYNHSQWKKVEKKINEDLFIDIRNNLRRSEFVYKQDLNRLCEFSRNFKEKRNYLYFKFPIRKKAENHLQKLCSQIKKFKDQVDSEKWKGKEESSYAVGSKLKLINTFLKKSSFEQKKTGQKYNGYKKGLLEITIQMRAEFCALQTLANLKFSEVPFKNFIVTSRHDKIINNA